MKTAKTRIIVVDDSAFMRKAITMMLESDPEIEVIATARDGAEGVKKVKELKPDLVTMDVEMPRMDGLTALRHIMEEEPTPVMMVSSITTEGAAATLEAMDLGAVDFIPKELSFVSLDIVKIKEELLEKIKNIARRKSILMARARQRLSWKKATSGKSAAKAAPASRAGKKVDRRRFAIKVVALGSSTGGPPALQAVITRLPKSFPVPILIVQHMPPKFTKSLADRLNSISEVTVTEARNGEEALAGHVYIAPGDSHMTLVYGASKPMIRLSQTPADTLYKPCVNVMMDSVVKKYGKRTLGVILTGMGNDGFAACKELNKVGGQVIAQNEESCVVYGMPRAIVDGHIADIVAPIEHVTDEIMSYF